MTLPRPTTPSTLGQVKATSRDGNSRLERALRLDDQLDSATKAAQFVHIRLFSSLCLSYLLSFFLSSNFFALVSVPPNFLMRGARIFVGPGRCYDLPSLAAHNVHAISVVLPFLSVRSFLSFMTHSVVLVQLVFPNSLCSCPVGISELFLFLRNTCVILGFSSAVHCASSWDFPS
jgi:hypothetical protein